MKSLIISTLLILAFGSTDAQSQIVSEHTASFSIEQRGRVYTSFWSDGNQTGTNKLDLGESIPVIVEFRETPLFLQQTRKINKTAKSTDPRARFPQFDLDLTKIHQDISRSVKGTSLQMPSVKQHFYKVFYGVSVTLPRADIAELLHLSYVKNVYPDYNVKAYLGSSVALIRADKVWSRLGSHGEGILVGELDTGIDYTHPALGGGIGPGFKVVGGYDFVNGDDDPLDDNGHGTHVAGIIAADGDTLKGVAPKARLMAYKVLNSAGEGASSWIIAAIERTVDPNEDDDFSDHLDIVNMSLGSSYGSPDDPQCTAVDNATALGITFCISAGNNGNYYTIGSPGMARSAITVGASTGHDLIADFSSRGPDPGIFSIKPDVVAPGSKINSTFLDGSTAVLSGTSMSTPHVTGTVALIKTLHPDWTPAQIKSAIMTTAIDLDADAMTQGAGRIDALNAAQAGAFATPSQLSFGLDNDTIAIWSSNDTIAVENQRSQMQNFHISFEYPQSTRGITLESSTNSLALMPGEKKTVLFTLTVDNNLVPYRNPDSPFVPYSGTVKITGERDSLHLPWAFLKTIQLKLIFEEPNGSAILSSTKAPPLFVGNITDNLRIFEFTGIQTGLYNLLAFNIGSGLIPPRIFVKENFTVAGSQTLILGKTQAPNIIDFNGVDEDGVLLKNRGNETENYKSRMLFVFPSSQSFIRDFASLTFNSDSLYVSNISAENTIYLSELQHGLGFDNRIYMVQYPPFSGLAESIKLNNQPADWVSQPISLLLPPDARDPYIELLLTFAHREKSREDHSSAGIVVGSVNAPDKKWQGILYLTKDVSETRGATVNLRAFKDRSAPPDEPPWFYTSDFRVLNGKIASFDYVTPTPVVYLGNGQIPLRFGEGPLSPDFLFVNSDQEIRAYLNYKGSLDERRYNDDVGDRYFLYDESGDLTDSGRTTKYPLGVIHLKTTPASYHLQIIQSNAVTQNKNVDATFDAFVDTRTEDPDPPIISSLKIINSRGTPVNRLQINETGTLLFSAADYHADPLELNPLEEDSTRVYFRQHGTKNWMALEIRLTGTDNSAISKSGHRPVGTIYTSDLSALTQGIARSIDLQFHTRDKAGNIGEWTLEPAFFIGDLPDELPIELPGKYALYPNYPNPFNNVTLIPYDLPEPSHVRLTIYDILGRKVATPLDRNRIAGSYIAEFDAGGLASGIYLYRLRAGNHTFIRRMLLIK